MDTVGFLSKLNNHTKEIYHNSITEVAERGGILNWLLGLSGGVLLFSYDKILVNGYNYYLIIIQSIIFLLIIIAGYFHREFTAKYRNLTISIIRMFEYLNFELELIPDVIEQDIKEKKFNEIMNDYVNGEYFPEEDQTVFNELNKKQNINLKYIQNLTVLSIFLMITEFICFFIGVYELNSN